MTTPASGPFTITYSHYANNYRVKKMHYGRYWVYIYSKALGSKMLAVYINGGLSREYVYVGGTLIATRLSNGVIQYHHSDHLEVRVTSDGSGSVIGYQGHYPFGESWYGNNGPFYNYRFTSYGWDSNVSQLYYASNRFYNYQIGRFQTPDLLDLTSTCSGPGMAHRFLLDPQSQAPQEANLFSYVINDPINKIDPAGLDFFPKALGPPCARIPVTVGPVTIGGITIGSFEAGYTYVCALDPFEGEYSFGPLSVRVNLEPDTRVYRFKKALNNPDSPQPVACVYEACCQYPASDLRSACNNLVLITAGLTGFELGCPVMIRGVVVATEVQVGVGGVFFSVLRTCLLIHFWNINAPLCAPGACTTEGMPR